MTTPKTPRELVEKLPRYDRDYDYSMVEKPDGDYLLRSEVLTALESSLRGGEAVCQHRNSTGTIGGPAFCNACGERTDHDLPTPPSAPVAVGEQACQTDGNGRCVAHGGFWYASQTHSRCTRAPRHSLPQTYKDMVRALAYTDDDAMRAIRLAALAHEDAIGQLPMTGNPAPSGEREEAAKWFDFLAECSGHALRHRNYDNPVDRAAHEQGQERYALAATALRQGVTKCKWAAPDDDGVFATECGREWVFTEGTPQDNDVKFCMGCGRPVKYAAIKEK